MRPTAVKNLSSHTTPERSGTAVSPETYEAVKDAILAVMAEHKQGIPLMDLPAAVAARLPLQMLEGPVLNWYTTVVKLDLEARGMLERVPGYRPQRLRLTPRQTL